MKLVFCSDPLSPRKPDEAYQAEAEAASTLRFEYVLIDYEALTGEADAQRTVRRVSQHEKKTTGLYRGWMLKPQQYEMLYDALAAKGIRLLNDPEAYRHCHYLSESYRLIEGNTPKSGWIRCGSDVSMEEVMKLLRPFGSSPVIVKDFVKSRKHEWEEACFIPSADNREAVERVVRRFLELQDEDLNEGLVFREFVEFEPLTQHSKSGMPLTLEFRIFFLDGKPVFSTEYWEEGDYHGERPPIERFSSHAQAIKSRFFTMDVAKRKNGDWMIVELGDGQVAGLPDNADPNQFYSAIKAMFGSEL